MAGSTWLKVDGGIFQHPKTRRVSRMLNISTVHVVGHLVDMWIWGMHVFPQGVLTGADASDIAEAAEWTGDPEEFLTALLSCGNGGAGFLERNEEGTLIFHDWDEYGGQLIRKREADAERKRKAANKTFQGNPADVPRNSTEGVSEFRPKKEKEREENQKEKTETDEKLTHQRLREEFLSIFDLVPGRNRETEKRSALQEYEISRKAGTSAEEIQAGIIRYRDYLAADPNRHPYNLTTFFEKELWRDAWKK